MVVDAAALAAILVATEAMVAERTGLVVEEGTVQAMTVGTAAWLSNFATVSEFRRGMVFELL
jgi:hypothetical protein